MRRGKFLGAGVDMLRKQWEARLPPMRSHATARALLDVLPAAPVLDANEAAERTGRSLVSARRGLEQLTELGILKPLNARKWGRGWEAPGLFDLVTEFERRTGRSNLRAAAIANTSAHATVTVPKTAAAEPAAAIPATAYKPPPPGRTGGLGR